VRAAAAVSSPAASPPRDPARAPGGSTADGRDSLRTAHRRPVSPAVFWELVGHLALRELESKHQLTLLGWAWPLVRQLAQLAVLVFVFSAVFDLGIENFTVFVFIGLIAWTWFSTGLADAASSVAQKSHLVLQSRVPTAVIPMVSVAVPLVDVVIALPVLLLMLGVSGDLRPELLLCPLLLPVQALLMAGIAWFASAAAVFFRDIPNVVFLGLTLTFYLTPIFYGLRSVPEGYVWLLELNPLATIIGAYRALLLGEPAPDAWLLAAVAIGSLVLAVAGYLFFRRLQPRFADHQ
jgi:lipopolysaccharide transport system permease protein